MKIFKTLLVAATIIAFLSCSENYGPPIEEYDLKGESRSSKTTNDSSSNVEGMQATIVDWIINYIDTMYAEEMPKDNVENDTIPDDGLPNDSIPSNSIPNDSTKNKEKNMELLTLHGHIVKS